MTPEERVLEAYYERLTVFPVDKSRVIAIEFQSADPELAAQASPTRSPRAISRCSRPRGRTRPARPANGSPARSTSCASKVAEAEAQGRGIPRQDQSVHRHQQHHAVEPDARRIEPRSRGRALAEGRARVEGAAHPRHAQARRPLESSDVVNSELIRRLNEQRVTLRAQLAEQSSTLLDNHPRIKELRAQIADLDRQIRDEARAACALAGERRQHRGRARRVADRQPRPAQAAGGLDQRAGRAAARARARGQGAARSARILSRQVPRGDRARQPRRGAGRCAHHLARGRVEHAVFPEEAADRADRDAGDAVHLGRLHHDRRAARAAMSIAAPDAAVEPSRLEPVPGRSSSRPSRSSRRRRPRSGAGCRRSRSARSVDEPRRSVEPRRGRRRRACDAPDELTIADLAQALREAGEAGKRVAVVGAARRHRHDA